MPNTDQIAVLVVEDEALVRMNVVASLEDEGFDVFAAGNASEAIGILAANPAMAIMFTDVDMPGGVDGLALAAAVRDRWPPSRSSSRPGTALSTAGRGPVHAQALRHEKGRRFDQRDGQSMKNSSHL